MVFAVFQGKSKRGIQFLMYGGVTLDAILKELESWHEFGLAKLDLVKELTHEEASTSGVKNLREGVDAVLSGEHEVYCFDSDFKYQS